jgi:hypothetical protein
MFYLCRILGPNVLVCSSLETALRKLQEPPLAETVESAWVIGGSSVYKVRNYYLLLQDAVQLEVFFFSFFLLPHPPNTQTIP